jgi:hypothetical protein
MEYEPGKSPLICNLMPGLTEVGKIKIGRKGEERVSQSGGKWRVPVKLDHFVVTTLERDKTDNFVVDQKIMKDLGPEPKKIPIRLLFDSIEANFQSRYSCYKGKTLWCSGDGRGAFRTNEKGVKDPVTCPCGREQPTHKGPEKCKINGCLACMIDGADTIGGVWKYRTTGYNSTVGIMSSLSLIRALSGGLLAGLSLDMTIQPKVGTDPDGKSVTIQVVGVVFRGGLVDLRKKTLEIASQNADFRARLANVEAEVVKQIGVDAELVDQAGDIVDEFHPEGDTAPTLQPPGTPQAPEQPPTAAVVQPSPAAPEAPKRGRGRPPAAAKAPEAPAPAPERTAEDATPFASAAAPFAPAYAKAAAEIYTKPPNPPAEPEPPTVQAPEGASEMVFD